MTKAPTETRIQTAGVHEPVAFDLKPTAEARSTLAGELGILGVKKLVFGGQVHPSGARDLTLKAKIGATVVQECVVTGDPVTTRIDEEVLRQYLADLPEPGLAETEMPEDENADPLPEFLDLSEVMAEALALALPAWPRAPGVEPVDISVTEPGKKPMTDDDAKPFAALKSLTNPANKNDPEGS